MVDPAPREAESFRSLFDEILDLRDQRIRELVTRVDGLEAAMESQAVIEQAKGLLMAHSPSITAEDAFDILLRASRRTDRTVRAVAERILDRRPAKEQLLTAWEAADDGHSG